MSYSPFPNTAVLDDAHARSTEMREPANSSADLCSLCRGQCWGTEMHSLIEQQQQDREAERAVATDSNVGTNIMQGDMVLTACDASSLIAAYERDRGSNTDDDPAADLAAMHQRHLTGSSEGLRRSVRVQNMPQKVDTFSQVANPRKRKSATDGSTTRPSKQKIPPLERLPRTKEELKWVSKDGKLTGARHTWSHHSGQATSVVPLSGFVAPTPRVQPSTSAAANTHVNKSSAPTPTALVEGESPTADIQVKAKKRTRGGYGQKNNYGRDDVMEGRAYKRGDAALSPTFSVIHDASVASTGWQGKKPTPIARARIDHLYRLEDDAAALYPYVKYFFPVHFNPGTATEPERGTFILDKNGIVFAYRSWRAMWLAEMITELETAQAILVGGDLKSKALQAACAKSARGPHLPIILGHQRQSSVKPYLTAWHRKNAGRVALFLDQPVVKAIIGWVSSVFRTIWPGLAARFETDAAYHLAEHGIKPLFGYFWNFCWNASFPGQARIHTGPHADCKNQVGVCMILVYVLKHGINFNHKFRSWIVLWEAELAIEMPPWVLTGYPSALFYHFNIDVHRFEFVYTRPGVKKPTRDNSWPIVDGDEAGRGSMVFFSQSTMRHGPATGFDTLEMAVEAGHSGTTDFGDDIQEAFQKAAIHTTITAEELAGFFAE